MIGMFWQRVMAHLVAEVPASISACEFDCPKASCDPAHFATCPRRLAGAAHGGSRKES